MMWWNFSVLILIIFLQGLAVSGDLCSNSTCYPKCRETTSGPECFCNDGFELQNDNKTCLDINECTNEGVCSQLCTNLNGTYRCSCIKGYDLINSTCRVSGEEPILMFTTIEYIWGFHLRSKKKFLIKKAANKASTIDSDPLESRVYWSEISNNRSSVYSSKIYGSGFEVILTNGLMTLEDIAVDYVARNLYLTDSGLSQILACKMDGSMCYVLHQTNVGKPRAIVVDPTHGFLYWSDWGDETFGIYRSGMDGSRRITLVSKDVKWPNGIAIDHTTNRLYWTDAHFRTIEYITLDGKTRKVLGERQVLHPYSLAVFEDSLYWTDWTTFSLDSCNKFTARKTNIFRGDYGRYIMGVHVHHPVLGLKTSNPCWNNSCSHMCLIAPLGSYRCACPPGFSLSRNNSTCTIDDHFPMLLVSDESSIYHIRPDAVGSNIVDKLPLTHFGTIGKLAYDWGAKTLFLSDLHQPAIYAVNMTNFVRRELVQNNLVAPEDLAYDSLNGNLYWVDSGKGSVEVVSIATSHVSTVVKNLSNPVAIALVPAIGRMFISTVGEHASVLMYDMDGRNEKRLSSIPGSAVALAIHPSESLLYWADPKAATISSIDYMNPISEPTILKEKVSNVVSLAVSDKYIYWTDTKHHVLSYLKHNTTLTFTMYLPESKNGTVTRRVMYAAPLKSRSPTENDCTSYEFQCISKTKCIPKEFVCDGLKDCDDGSDEKCDEKPNRCPGNDFRCSNGRCILSSWKCDRRDDCGDNSDEEGCPALLSCTQDQFSCGSGECIEKLWRCDGETDCTDDSDESDCHATICDQETQFRCDHGQCIPALWACDGAPDCFDNTDETNCPKAVQNCSAEEFRCTDGTCINSTLVCNHIKECEDESDEANCPKEVKTCSGHELNCTAPTSCAKDQFSCGGGECIPKLWRCDGEADCADATDESDCHATACDPETQVRCDHGQCIPASWACDGAPDCFDNTDEANCTKEVKTCSAREFRCADGSCIDKTLVCDSRKDCEDESDEKNCSHTNVTCSKENHHLCKDGKTCIYTHEVCDGYKDCEAGDDEFNCTRIASQCTLDEYFCTHNSRCISRQWICDGDNDCGDLADEIPESCTKRARPTLLPHKSILECEEFSCGLSGECIPWSSVCDGVTDCGDLMDEGRLCATACQGDNGGCAHKCQKTPVGQRCSCYNGYALSEDDRTCEDINECEMPGSCSHFCNNTKGGFKCACADGYFLEHDHKRCKADGGAASFVYLLPDQIRGIDLSTRTTRVYVKDDGADMRGMDYDAEEGLFFWSDWKEGTINSYIPNTNKQDLILTTSVRPHYLRWNWISKNIYYTDNEGSIVSCSRDGKYCTTAIQNAAPHINSFDISPTTGLMFWSVWEVILHRGPGVIERAELDGSHRMVIVSDKIVWPTAVTVDHILKMLYWTDAKLNVMECTDFHGLKRRSVVAEDLYYPFSMTMFEDYVYWSDWGTDSLIRCDKFGGQNCIPFHKNNVKAEVLMVVHKVKQPKGVNYCDHNRCPQLCLPTRSSYTCKCDNLYVLKNSTCVLKPTASPLTTTAPSCPEDYCFKNAKCVVLRSGKYHCVCPENFKGDKCEIRILATQDIYGSK